MRILGIERDNTACNHYRVFQPLNKLGELGLAEVALLKESELHDDMASQMALWADVLVFQRPATEDWYKFIKICRKAGKVIISDYDDDPFNTSPFNPYYGYIGTEEFNWRWPDGTVEKLWAEDMVSSTGKQIFNIDRNINHRDMFRLNFKKSDMVTCTTDILREQFLKINQSVGVLPNLIDPNFFPESIDKRKREIRIGWQGGASHYEDLYMIKDVVKEMLLKHSNVKFVYFGDYRFQGLFKDCPQNQIEIHGWVGHATYPYKLALLNLDIGLCPLVDNIFNKNKSAIKWMEYSTMKVATIASRIEPYSPVIQNGVTGLLVSDDKKEWLDAIDHLVLDESYRMNMANKSCDDVLENHNADKSAHLWLKAYQQAMKPSEVTV